MAKTTINIEDRGVLLEIRADAFKAASKHNFALDRDQDRVLAFLKFVEHVTILDQFLLQEIMDRPDDYYTE